MLELALDEVIGLSFFEVQGNPPRFYNYATAARLASNRQEYNCLRIMMANDRHDFDVHRK